MEMTYESFLSFCDDMVIEPAFEGELPSKLKNAGVTFKKKLLKFIEMVKDAIKKFVLWLSKTFGFDDVYIATDVQKYANAINTIITQTEASHSYSGHGEYYPFTDQEKNRINTLVSKARIDLDKEYSFAISGSGSNVNNSTGSATNRKFVKASKSDLQNQIKKIEDISKALETESKNVDNDSNARKHAADLMYAENKRLELMRMMMSCCIRKNRPKASEMA